MAGRKWTKEEDLMFRLWYPTADKDQLMEILPGRTWQSIATRAKEFGIKKSTYTGKKVKWTTETDSELLQLAESGKYNHREISELMDRSIGSIRTRLSKLRNSPDDIPKQSGFMYTYEEVFDYVEYIGKSKLISTEYKNSKTNMKFKCKCGEEFFTTFANFKDKCKHVCNNCSSKRSSTIQKHSKDRFISELLEVRPKFFEEYEMIGEYTGKKNKIDFLHKECGNVWRVDPIHLIKRNQNCGHCSPTKKKTHREYVREVYDLVGCEYSVLSLYNSTNENIMMKHNKCGHVWSMPPTKFVSSEQTRCPKCVHNSKVEYDELLERCTNLGANLITTRDEYSRMYDKLKFKCSCGNIFYRKFHMVKKSDNGNICVECSRKSTGELQALNPNEFKFRFYDVLNADEYELITEYKRSNISVDVIHKHCGNFFKIKPSKLNQLTVGCPICNSSSYERRTYEWLCKNIGRENVDREVFFDDLIGDKFPLRFDFAVYTENELRLLIEIDGEYHYKVIVSEQNLLKQQRYDDMKDRYCERNKINLLRIPYWEFDNIETILYEKLNELL